MLRGVSIPSPLLPHTIGRHSHILRVYPGEFLLQLGGRQQGHLCPFIPGEGQHVEDGQDDPQPLKPLPRRVPCGSLTSGTGRWPPGQQRSGGMRGTGTQRAGTGCRWGAHLALQDTPVRRQGDHSEWVWIPQITPARTTALTLMSRRKLAEKRDIWIFSRRENCCRIPPADSTVEALEY